MRASVAAFNGCSLWHVKVRVLEEEACEVLREAGIGWGDVCVTEKVVGYKKVKFHTHENAGYGDVRLPDVDLHTTSFWLSVPSDVAMRVGRATAIEGLGVGGMNAMFRLPLVFTE